MQDFFCNTSSASETTKRPRGTQKNENYLVRYGGNISNQTHNIVLVKRFQIEAFRIRQTFALLEGCKATF